MQTITEGKARLNIHLGKISKRLPVFYNPLMEFNRSTTIAFLNSIRLDGAKMALPMAGSGIRGIRILLESEYKPSSILFNDINQDAAVSIRENLKLNKISTDKIIIENKEANIFMLENRHFDYIDIDPFGSPNPFITNAVAALKRDAYLGVTCTDLGSLAGSYPNTCRRIYWAKPINNCLMHEAGLRILIRKIQLVASQYNKALTPLFSFCKDHYYRIFFRSKESKRGANMIQKEEKYLLFCKKCLDMRLDWMNNKRCICGSKLDYYGPLYAGTINDKTLLKKIKFNDFLDTLYEESKIDTPFFLDTHTFASVYRKEPKKIDTVIKHLKKEGISAARTIFNPNGIRTDDNSKAVRSILKLY